MGKAETVAKYADEFLKGKSEEAKARFREKELGKQYASIMQWRSKQRKSSGSREVCAADIAALIKQAKSELQRLSSLDERESRTLYAEIDALRLALGDYEEEQRQRRIRDLETRREEINRELQRLRGTEPGLFDGFEEEEDN